MGKALCYFLHIDWSINQSVWRSGHFGVSSLNAKERM